jgi:site-specific DNA recombinase
MADDFVSLSSEFDRIAKDQGVLGDPLGEPAYLYCRLSDKVQAKEGKESLSRQLLFGHEKARENGHYIPLKMVYYDLWTGKEVERPEFYRLLADVKEDKRSAVVYIDQTDRLSRRKAVYYVLSHDLTRYGLEPIFGDDEDELVRHIKLAFDELELEKRRYRQIQANKARAQKGHTITKFAPFGYDLTEDKKQYRINGHQAIWVRKIYEWITAGRSLNKIVEGLTGKIKTPTGRRQWNPSTVRKIIKNGIYKGVYISNREVIEYVWEGGKKKKVYKEKPEEEWIYVDVPAIVSEELWEEAQIALKRNKERAWKNAKRYHWLLSGILRCVCGYSRCCMRSTKRKKLKSGWKTYVYEFYVCGDRSKTYREHHCDRGMISKPRLEGFVLEAIDMMFLNPDLWEQSIEEFGKQEDHWQTHVDFHQEQIDEIDKQLETLLEMALENRTETAKRLFTEKQQQLEKQRQDHEKELMIARQKLLAVKQKEGRRDAVRAAIDHYHRLGGIKSLSYEQQREVIVTLVDEIILDPKEQWFEIRGALSDVFSYVDDRVVTTSGARHSYNRGKTFFAFSFSYSSGRVTPIILT